MRPTVFILLLIFLSTVGFSQPAGGSAPRKMLVLGIDGMDPVLLQKYMDEGKMPHFRKMIAEGGDFKSLGTSYPPQSPVAWSSFAIGANPGRHGIFDFIHRHAETMMPYLSITETKGPEKKWTLGDWQIPLSSGTIRNLRGGKPYWEYLCEQDISSTICQFPANYPPTCPCQSSRLKVLSGMGTPDLLGTQGTFSFYTTEKVELVKEIGGGRMYFVDVVEDKVEARFYGPPHPYKNPKKFRNRKDALALSVPFTVWIDSDSEMAKLEIGGEAVFLKQGEFSGWVPIRFAVIPLIQNVSAMVRFYLQEVSPHFKLYVSPLNIDPTNPAVPISEPASYARELAEAVGKFYTVLTHVSIISSKHPEYPSIRIYSSIGLFRIHAKW